MWSGLWETRLHFRIFGFDGKIVLDTTEKKLTEKAEQIASLKKDLTALWPPHALATTEKNYLVSTVASVVGHSLKDVNISDYKQLMDQADQLRVRMQARVPIKGSLSFLDSHGVHKAVGIDVGAEQPMKEPRSHIEGATPSTAIWRFGRRGAGPVRSAEPFHPTGPADPGSRFHFAGHGRVGAGSGFHAGDAD